jgi:hypothetical protein
MKRQFEIFVDGDTAYVDEFSYAYNKIPPKIQILCAFTEDRWFRVKGRAEKYYFRVDEVLERGDLPSNWRITRWIYKSHDETTWQALTSGYSSYTAKRDDGRSKSRVPKIGYESPPGSGRRKR